MKRSDVRDLIIIAILVVSATALVTFAGATMVGWLAAAVFWTFLHAPWVAGVATLLVEVAFALAVVLLLYLVVSLVARLARAAFRHIRHA